jgi:hypothetical protein
MLVNGLSLLEKKIRPPERMTTYIICIFRELWYQIQT